MHRTQHVNACFSNGINKDRNQHVSIGTGARPHIGHRQARPAPTLGIDLGLGKCARYLPCVNPLWGKKAWACPGRHAVSPSALRSSHHKYDKHWVSQFTPGVRTTWNKPLWIRKILCDWMDAAQVSISCNHGLPSQAGGEDDLGTSPFRSVGLYMIGWMP